MLTWNETSALSSYSSYSETSSYSRYGTNGNTVSFTGTDGDHIFIQGETQSAYGYFSTSEGSVSGYTSQEGNGDYGSFSTQAPTYNSESSNGGGGDATTEVASGFSSSSIGYTISPGASYYSAGVITSVFTGSSTSATWQNSYDLVTTDSSSTVDTVITSSTYTLSTVSYTSALSGTVPTLVTTSQQTTSTGTLLSSTYTADDGDGSYSDYNTYNPTVTASRSYLLTTSTNVTAAAPIDVGTVVSAQGNEWLWVPTVSYNTSFNTHCSFITDIGSSFIVSTFWKHYVTSEVSFYTYNTPVSSTISNPASTTRFTATQYLLDYANSYTVEVTSGDDLKRSTTSTQIIPNQTSTYTFVAGWGSYSVAIPGYGYGPLVKTVSTTANVGILTSWTTLLASGLDSVTTTISNTLAVATSYSYSDGVDADYYQASVSGSAGNSNGTTTFHTIAGRSATALNIVFPNAVQYTASALAVFEQVPKRNGMYAPASINQGAAMGTNIDLAPTIYYPYTSSVLDGVVTPLRTHTTTSQHDTNKTATTSTTLNSTYSYLSFGYPVSKTYSYGVSSTYTDVTNWSYSWSSFTLFYTSATSSTYASGSQTLTSYSSHSTTASMDIGDAATGTYFSGVAAGQSYDTLASSVFNSALPLGGYSPIRTDTALGLYPPGGRLITNYDSKGSTTTVQTIIENVTSASLSGTVHVDQILPIFSTGTGGNLYIATFTAYQTTC